MCPTTVCVVRQEFTHGLRGTAATSNAGTTLLVARTEIVDR
jgi:hypothetical protein